MTDLPKWPRLKATCAAHGGGEILINGTSHVIEAPTHEATRDAIRERAADVATHLERPVRVTVVDHVEAQTVHLVVDPDGSISPEPGKTVEQHKVQSSTVTTTDERNSTMTDQDHDKTDLHSTYSESNSHSDAGTPEQAPQTAPADELDDVKQLAPRTRRQARQSFLTQATPDKPATAGWRGIANQLGLRLSPSAEEQAERDDTHAVSQHWAGPRTIAVVNGKGGAGKTPTSILLSAVFARYGGGGVLAWDNNQTRGTLGWRTEQAAHEATLLDLLPAADNLLSPGAQLGDLAHYTHHQTDDRFDVLRSKPKVLADAQRFTQDDVDTIHAVAAKFYRLIIIDSGNDESDPLWRQMITHTDQLVVATTTSDEKAEAGALLLEDLAKTGDHGLHLADNAVAVVSQAEANAKPRDVDHIATGYASLAREVVTIPYDPAMVDGHLRYDALRESTKRAWLRAGAAVAHGLNRH